MRGAPVESLPVAAGHVAELDFDAAWERDLDGTRVLYGAGRLEELGALAHGLGARRVLVVTDPGVAAAGHPERALASLRGAGLTAELFAGVDENPTDANVEAGVLAARQARSDLLVGLGGGSAMDCAKGVNLLLTNGGRIADFEGFVEPRRPLLPAVGVPTTAGTGSEAQSYALITDSGTHRKMACGAAGARFQAVILDPSLTDSLPPRAAGAGALDAVAHAVESYVTTRRTATSSRLAAAAWALLDRHLAPALARPGDHREWGALQSAALLAGAAIERSMLGAAHACANPLTQRFGTPHGVAVALMLPAVVRYNTSAVAALYAELMTTAPPDEAGEALARRIEALRAAAGLPHGLRQVGVAAGDLEPLAEQASRQWTLGFNPRPASITELEGLYRDAL